MNETNHDFIVIGAGIAGASIAAHLAARGRVLLLEAEAQPGYHTTGRSAALFSTIYGNAVVRALSRASRDFLFQPPPGFSDVPLVRPRSTMFFARADQLDLLCAAREDDDVRRATRLLGTAEAHRLVPVFRPGYLGGAMLEKDSADIDVHALHQGYLRAARRQGAALLTDRPVVALARHGGRWTVRAGDTEYRAPVVVDAAGAWGDRVAAAAGLPTIGLQPLRRTALVIDAPGGVDPESWPAAIAIDESYYFRPEGARLLLSPADETPSEPCDAQPEDWDVAVAVDHFERATAAPVPRVLRRWAGLRVFTADRTPVAGFEPGAEGFFWFVGQGGYGIQLAEALACAGAAIACDEPLPDALLAHGLRAADLSPLRPGLQRKPLSPSHS